MKSYTKIFLIFLFTILISLIFSVLIYYIQGLILDPYPEAKPFHFLKILSRILTIVLFCVMIWVFRKIEKISPLNYGLRYEYNSRFLLAGGFAFGIISMFTIIIINIILSETIFHLEPITLSFYFNVVFQLLVVFIIALVEEWFFRGFILQSLAVDFGISKAILISSFIFALTHFIRPTDNWLQLVPEFIGLFLIGVILAKAWDYTKSLYFSIGVHAGWVYIVKLDKYFVNHFDSSLQTAFGGEKLLKSATTWILIILVLFFLKKIIGFFTLGILKKNENLYR